MDSTPKYYIVEASALPEVFLKVAEAKRLLDSGEASTVGEATKLTGISRSAFYKYRDVMMPFQSLMAGRIITFQLALKDRTGVLSGILSIFAYNGANILTINQNIPIDSVATVTFSIRFEQEVIPTAKLRDELSKVRGVVDVKIISGE
jgi:chorismate mutase